MVDMLANAVRLIIEVLQRRRSETGRLMRPRGFFLLTGAVGAEAILSWDGVQVEFSSPVL